MTTQPSLDALPPDGHDAFASALVGARIGGRYVVERILGRGGMGVVAHARHAELEQSVAIKLMWPEHAAHPTLNARFLREARLAAEVHSGHLVRVFDVGRLDSGVPYLVMEMLAGRDLGAELRSRGTLPIDEAIDWILQAATGIAEFHARGVVHRDLKPSNLFLADGAGSQTVKVLDFGVSKESLLKKTSDLTASEHLIGTPHYMSPEQIKAPNSVDTRSDIWSVGVILYELLTGTLPFETEADGVGELFGLILFTEPRRARRDRPEIPQGLDDVIARCLRRSRDERYATVAELAVALAPFAPERSRHRIDAIARAMKHTVSAPPVVASDARLVVTAVEEAPKSTIALGRKGGAASDADALKLEGGESEPPSVAASAGGAGSATRAFATPEVRPRREPDAGSVAGALWSSDTASKAPPRRTAWLVASAVALALAVATFVLLASRAAPLAPAASAASASEAPAATARTSLTAATPEVSPPSVVAPLASAPPPPATPNATPTPSAAPPAAPQPPSAHRALRPRPPPVAASSGGPARAAAPTASTDLLILDRK